MKKLDLIFTIPADYTFAGNNRDASASVASDTPVTPKVMNTYQGGTELAIVPGGIYELVAGVGVAMAHVAITDSPDTVPSSGDYSWENALAIPPFAYAVLEEDRIETILEND